MEHYVKACLAAHATAISAGSLRMVCDIWTLLRQKHHQNCINSKRFGVFHKHALNKVWKQLSRARCFIQDPGVLGYTIATGIIST